MDPALQKAVTDRAAVLVNEHFATLASPGFIVAKEQLYFPAGLGRRPLDFYVHIMHQLAPFRDLSVSVTNFDKPRMRRPIPVPVATVYFFVAVDCALGRRDSEVSVWWFPESDVYRISWRPSHWVSEANRAGIAVPPTNPQR